MLTLKKWTGLSTLLPPFEDRISSFNETHCLARVRKGDRQAFQSLLEQYYDTIYQVAYRFTGHSEDAEDITQDVCVGLADKIGSYRGDAQFKTWLYRLIINACLDAHRKTDRQNTNSVNYLEFAEHKRTVSHDKNQQITWLYRELAKFDEPFKETAFLVLAQDLSHAEVAQILGCTESTISWRMYEIRNKLKALMESGHAG